MLIKKISWKKKAEWQAKSWVFSEETCMSWCHMLHHYTHYKYHWKQLNIPVAHLPPRVHNSAVIIRTKFSHQFSSTNSVTKMNKPKTKHMMAPKYCFYMSFLWYNNCLKLKWNVNNNQNLRENRKPFVCDSLWYATHEDIFYISRVDKCF